MKSPSPTPTPIPTGARKMLLSPCLQKKRLVQSPRMNADPSKHTLSCDNTDRLPGDCRGEPRISGSSCEAEIKAVDEGTKTTQYVRFLEQELGIGDARIPTPVFNDNKGAVDWSQTGKVSKKLRHVNIREFRVRQSRKAREIDMGFIPGKQNPSDLLTKEHKSPEDYRSSRDVVVSRRPDGGC